MVCVPATSKSIENDASPLLSALVAKIAPFFFRVTVPAGTPEEEATFTEKTRALPAVEGFPEGQAIPVIINPIVTELGNLELWMKHTGSDRRWKVEYQVRME